MKSLMTSVLLAAVLAGPLTAMPEGIKKEKKFFKTYLPESVSGTSGKNFYTDKKSTKKEIITKKDTMKTEYKKVESTDFYSEQSFKSILERLEKIQPDAQRQWGSMTAAEMLHHLNLAIGSGIGYYTLADESTFFSRGFGQFMFLDVLKRFPIGAATPSTLKVSGTYDFDAEKKQLKEILQKAYSTKTDNEWSRHTYFGRMSRKDWGKLIMIHCNHHFQQFSN